MPQTDAEHRLLAGQAAHRLDGVGQRLRVAGAVGEEDAVRLLGQHVVGRGRARQHRHLAADLHQTAQDVVLHAEVEGDDVMRRRPRAADR